MPLYKQRDKNKWHTVCSKPCLAIANSCRFWLQSDSQRISCWSEQFCYNIVVILRTIITCNSGTVCHIYSLETGRCWIIKLKIYNFKADRCRRNGSCNHACATVHVWYTRGVAIVEKVNWRGNNFRSGSIAELQRIWRCKIYLCFR